MRNFKKNVWVLLIAVGMFQTIAAQEEPVVKGDPTVSIFSNFNNKWNGTTNNSAFEVLRAYFGYNMKFDDNFSGAILLDAGNPNAGDFQYSVYIKNAYLSYKTGNLKASFGVQGLTQFRVAEKFDNHRFIEKSMQDLEGFGHSADLGLVLDYKISDNLSADFSFTNGEGYKKNEADEAYKTAIGVTATNLLEGLTLRGYFDHIDNGVAQTTIDFFAGYKTGPVKFGVTYTLQNNFKMVDNQDLTGISVVGGYDISETRQVFGRFDNLKSNKIAGATTNWNQPNDGDYVILGYQQILNKNITSSINFRLLTSDMSGINTINMIYLNFQLKL